MLIFQSIDLFWALHGTVLDVKFLKLSGKFAYKPLKCSKKGNVELTVFKSIRNHVMSDLVW